MSKPSTSYQLISTAFCVIVILSNIISAKMVPLPFFNDFSIPAGLMTYPLTFLLSDLITEIFGAKKAKRMVYTTLGMNILALLILQIALSAPSQSAEEHAAFHAVLGLSGMRIFSSLAAYTISQIACIRIYTLLKQWTGLKFLWVRANGSTWISQLIDTAVLDLLFFYWGMGMGLNKVVPIILFSFGYKVAFSIALTPLYYFLVLILKPKFPQNETTISRDKMINAP